jgi:hypothetical protein
MGDMQHESRGDESSLGGMASQAQEKVQQGAQQMTGKATGMLRDQVRSRSDQATEQLHGMAEALRRTSHDLHGQGSDGPARMIDRATDGVERAASYLERSDPDALLNDIEQFGRRNPWAMIVGGLALGFAASRVLKASSRTRFDQTYGRTRHEWPQREGSTGTPSTPALPTASMTG